MRIFFNGVTNYWRRWIARYATMPNAPESSTKPSSGNCPTCRTKLDLRVVGSHPRSVEESILIFCRHCGREWGPYRI